ncbi:hypothetical protein IFR05_003066 [Cadophora sp. M221]|nr:hypothetical protein IFR05_003066 [Cadophora sp. M221]
MCQIVNFSVCGHRDIDRSPCKNIYPATHPCEPISTDWTLPSECYRCRETFLHQVAKRPSVKEYARKAAARAALNSPVAASSLFTWPARPAGKPRESLSSDSFEGNLESPTIVRDERGWSPGPRTPLPCQHTTDETVMVPYLEKTLPPAPKPAHRASHPSPRVASTVQETARLPLNLTTSTPQPKVIAPPQASSVPEQPASVPTAEAVPDPTPAVRSRPKIDRSSNRVKPRPRSTRLRDAYLGLEASHTPEVAPPKIQRKPLPSYPAWTTLPSQIEERSKAAGEVWRKTQSEWDRRQTVHTPKQELFLTSPVKEITLDQGGLPSCLQPGKPSPAHDLARISTMFNLFSETGRESSIKCKTSKLATTITTTPSTYKAYPGAQAVKSASEIPPHPYAAHEVSKSVSVEFVDRKTTAAPYTTYKPVSKMKGTSQFPAPVPVEFKAAASCKDGPLTTRNSLSELPTTLDRTSKSCQGSSVDEFVCANYSGRESTPTATLHHAKRLSEPSAIFNMETRESQIELEGYSSPSTPSQDCKASAWLNTVGSYDCYNPLKSTAEVVSELPETTTDRMLRNELPSVTPLPVMTFAGNALERVFGRWSRTS